MEVHPVTDDEVRIKPPQIIKTTRDEVATVTSISAPQRRAVFPISGGDVIILFPDGMTKEGLEELEAYLAVFLKHAKPLPAERNDHEDA